MALFYVAHYIFSVYMVGTVYKSELVAVDDGHSPQIGNRAYLKHESRECISCHMNKQKKNWK